jgi:hypothetical protein
MYFTCGGQRFASALGGVADGFAWSDCARLSGSRVAVLPLESIRSAITIAVLAL